MGLGPSAGLEDVYQEARAVKDQGRQGKVLNQHTLPYLT